MRLSSRLLAIALCLSVACACFAQGGGQGRRGRGNNTSLVGLVSRPDVQADLALTDDEKTKLAAMAPAQGGGGGGGAQMSPEERRAAMAEREKQLAAILTPDQFKRLHEIQIQLMGPMAITNKEVQTGLGLSDTQISQITEQTKSYQEASASLRAKQQDGSLDRAAARQETQKNMATYRENLAKILTPEQTDKLKAMGGKPFTPAAPAGGR